MPFPRDCPERLFPRDLILVAGADWGFLYWLLTDYWTCEDEDRPTQVLIRCTHLHVRANSWTFWRGPQFCDTGGGRRYPFTLGVFGLLCKFRTWMERVSRGVHSVLAGDRPTD